MIRVDFTPKMLEEAASRDHGAYNDRSFLRGRGNITGFLGEIMVKEKFPNFTHEDKFSYDFSIEGLNVEVKTKAQTVPYPPYDYYEASVALDSQHQTKNADIYIFCRVFKNRAEEFEHGWIIGWLSVEQFKKRGRFLRKGTKDGDNGYVVRADCYNIQYKQLNKFS
jgi:hypothetical protein